MYMWIVTLTECWKVVAAIQLYVMEMSYIYILSIIDGNNHNKVILLEHYQTEICHALVHILEFIQHVLTYWIKMQSLWRPALIKINMLVRIE